MGGALGAAELEKIMSYAEIAKNFKNWNEYFNTDGEMSEAEFDALTMDERIELLVKAFGPSSPKAA